MKREKGTKKEHMKENCMSDKNRRDGVKSVQNGTYRNT
jgi:hypothetical protein